VARRSDGAPAVARRPEAQRFHDLLAANDSMHPSGDHRLAMAILGACVLLASGCHALISRPQPRLAGPQVPPPVPSESVPTEKDKSTLPAYTIEPPDILVIEAVRVVPKPPYRIQATDVLGIESDVLAAEGAEPKSYLVDAAGRVDFGLELGKVKIGGLTEDEAVQAIREAFIKKDFSEPQVSVQLIQSSGMQPITGEHLVAPDGRVNLGTYGSVDVAGLTLEAAKQAIEAQLANYLDDPKVSVSVYAYNSKVYYVITEGAGLGDLVARLPITGNETVLDAISQINGLSRISSKKIWIARPNSLDAGCDTILPVDWKEITKGAATATNYQVLPGDRIFIAENKLVALDAALNNVIAPIERVFGVSLLGTQTIQTINRFPLGISGFGSSGF
jgi:protein involved in polysaccharide export with SLBB domain